ncbi:MAG: tRNA dihydrouridine synthase DusB [Acidobacteriota bacterium]|nr:tRNA dihydrouridine synthase DusB [Acidobacteriota bacterium]MDH3785990.1 tRNA dihydrouridine synthase DusB [Acidobacteriota bacterium]
MLRYGNLSIDPPLVLAPMAGITDRQFRLVLRRVGGVGLVTMEFISSEALTRGNKRTLQMMHYVEEERPISIQIYGSDPSRMAEAARVVEGIGADICDINMGCPANKILKGCAGCSLMSDLDLAQAIIREVRGAIKIPLTVKFRAGIRDTSLNYLELGRICQGEGVDAVALHPRTAKQMYRGTADWSRIARLREALTIPVIGNGDVTEAEDVRRMMRETGCDGVMIGRASMRNPWIYRQAQALLRGEPVYQPTLEDRHDVIVSHFRLMLEQEADPKFRLHKLRTFTGWYTRGLVGGKHLRLKISGLDTPNAFLDAVEEFFEQARAAA